MRAEAIDLISILQKSSMLAHSLLCQKSHRSRVFQKHRYYWGDINITHGKTKKKIFLPCFLLCFENFCRILFRVNVNLRYFWTFLAIFKPFRIWFFVDQKWLVNLFCFLFKSSLPRRIIETSWLHQNHR